MKPHNHAEIEPEALSEQAHDGVVISPDSEQIHDGGERLEEPAEIE